MHLPTHLVVGTLCCADPRRRWHGLAVAFASHFVLDAMPHLDAPALFGVGQGATQMYSWRLAKIALSLAVLPLAWVLWCQFRRRGCSLGVATYKIGGGLIALSPDVWVLCPGHGSLTADLDAFAHSLWLPTWNLLACGSPTSGPQFVIASALIEIAVLLASLGLLVSSYTGLRVSRVRRGATRVLGPSCARSSWLPANADCGGEREPRGQGRLTRGVPPHVTMGGDR